MIIKSLYFCNYLGTNKTKSRMKKIHHSVLRPMLPPISYTVKVRYNCVVSL